MVAKIIFNTFDVVQQIKDLKESLKTIKAKENPIKYGDVLRELGFKYISLSKSQNTKKNLKNAINTFRKGTNLKGVSTEIFHAHIGFALAALSKHENRKKNLIKAIKSFKVALNLINSDNNPSFYAKLQLNLGQAHYFLSDIQDIEPNLKIALNAYQEAIMYYDNLEEYTEIVKGMHQIIDDIEEKLNNLNNKK